MFLDVKRHMYIFIIVTTENFFLKEVKFENLEKCLFCIKCDVYNMFAYAILYYSTLYYTIKYYKVL